MTNTAKKVRKGFYTYNGHLIVNRELGGQKHWAIFEEAPEGSELPMSMYHITNFNTCLLYTSPSPRDGLLSRMPSSA